MKINPKTHEFIDILLQWQNKINLISKHTINAVWNRHVLDSFQLITYIEGKSKIIIDLGSGAGFPGVILAINNPENQYYLIESNSKKAAFLNTVKQELGLTNMVVINERIEMITNLKADYITARGLVNLRQLLIFSTSLLKENGKGIFLKGKNYIIELKQAEDILNCFSMQVLPNLINPEGKIIVAEYKKQAKKLPFLQSHPI